MHLKTLLVILFLCLGLNAFGQCGSGEFKQKGSKLTWTVGCLSSFRGSFVNAIVDAGYPISGSSLKMNTNYGTVKIKVKNSKRGAYVVIEALGEDREFLDPQLNALTIRLNKVVKKEK